MRMACAFVLASNHKWTLQYNKGELRLTAGSLENVDLSMLAAIQHWHNMPGDALTYEFFLRVSRVLVSAGCSMLAFWVVVLAMGSLLSDDSCLEDIDDSF
jgi:hypothetical protein